MMWDTIFKQNGLRQGDPSSQVLFNLVADMLAVFIARAKEDVQIQGLIPHLMDDGLSILQYADDTILYMEHNLEQAKNVNIILCAFGHLSSLKIKFHERMSFLLWWGKNLYGPIFIDFGCGMGQMAFKYLGIPMNHRKLNNKDWKAVEECFKKMSSWKGKLLSHGGRLVLFDQLYVE